MEMRWAVLVKCMAADRQNMGPSIFFVIFYYKYKNFLGQFYAKSCYKPKWAKSVLVRQPMAIG